MLNTVLCVLVDMDKCKMLEDQGVCLSWFMALFLVLNALRCSAVLAHKKWSLEMKSGLVVATGKAWPGAGGLPLIQGPLPRRAVFCGGHSVRTRAAAVQMP